MSATETAIRLADCEPGDLPKGLDLKKIQYWKQSSTWMFYIPGGGIGNLSEHDVTEHEDGTITVRPSIAIGNRKSGRSWGRHGFLERGEWREV